MYSNQYLNCLTFNMRKPRLKAGTYGWFYSASLC
jgi:hypothetical protein